MCLTHATTPVYIYIERDREREREREKQRDDNGELQGRSGAVKTVAAAIIQGGTTKKVCGQCFRQQFECKREEAGLCDQWEFLFEFSHSQGAFGWWLPGSSHHSKRSSFFSLFPFQLAVDFGVMNELLRDEEMNQLESVVVAKMGDLDSLCDAFRGCHAVFHTSSFIDIHGVSGYSEWMAFLETEAARNVIEACCRAAYVKRCVFTSSLLASIWTDDDRTGIIDESCWSDEEFCRDRKLWLAMGKTAAEKVAWSKSQEMKVKLVTVCPGLLMAPSFPNAHTETSVPYLKGGRMMLQRGVLATNDISKVAKAHVHVYEEMDYGACGRYFCFERVVRRLDEAIQLENNLKMHGQLSGGGNLPSSTQETDGEIQISLSNSKLAKLMLRVSQRSSCKQSSLIAA